MKELNTSQGDNQSPGSLKSRLSRILMNTKKELKFLIHDKLAIALLLLLPITFVLTVHFADFGGSNSSSSSGENYSRFQTPTIGIVDLDESQGFHKYDLSEEFVSIFESYEKQGEMILYTENSRKELEKKIGLGEIDAYIVVNDGFEFNLSTHFVGYFSLVVDSYNQLMLMDVQSLVEECSSVFSEKFNFTGAISHDIKYVNVPEEASRLFQLAPLFFPMILFSMACLVSSQSIVGDVPKDRMILTPLSKGELLLGKIFASLLINLLMVFAISSLSLLFGIKLRGDSIIFFFILWTCSVVGTAAGLLISALSKSSLSAFQLFILTFITQVILILFIESQFILSFFPIWTTMKLIREVSQQGLGLFESGSFIPYLNFLWIEFFILIFLTYITYKKKESLL